MKKYTNAEIIEILKSVQLLQLNKLITKREYINISKRINKLP